MCMRLFFYFWLSTDENQCENKAKRKVWFLCSIQEQPPLLGFFFLNQEARGKKKRKEGKSVQVRSLLAWLSREICFSLTALRNACMISSRF